MTEHFTIFLKDGSSFAVNYPKDSLNPFKMSKFREATIENVVKIEGTGKMARELRVRYGLEDGTTRTTLELIAETSGVSKENILKQKEKVIRKMESLQKRLEKVPLTNRKLRKDLERRIAKLRKRFPF